MVGIIPDPAAGLALADHLSGVRERLRPHTTGGAYLNFLEGEERVARTRAAFTPDDHRRRQARKRQYGPEYLFRFGVDPIGE